IPNPKKMSSPTEQPRPASNSSPMMCTPAYNAVVPILAADLAINAAAFCTNLLAVLILRANRDQSRMRIMLYFLSVVECCQQAVSALYTVATLTVRAVICFSDTAGAGQEPPKLLDVFSDARIVAIFVRNFWVALIAITRWDAVAKPLRPRFNAYGRNAFLGILAVTLAVASLLILPPHFLADVCAISRYYTFYSCVSNVVPFIEESQSPKEESQSPRKSRRVLRRVAESKEESQSPKEESQSPKEESQSPKEESQSPKESRRSPKEESQSPKEESQSPKEESQSPKKSRRVLRKSRRVQGRVAESQGRVAESKKSPKSPKEESQSPKEESQKQESQSPKEESQSPRKSRRVPRKSRRVSRKSRRVQEESQSPRKSRRVPKEESQRGRVAEPKEESQSPKEESQSPKEESQKSKEESQSPKEESQSPKEESQSRKSRRGPKEESQSPKEESQSPKEESQSPKEESQSPRKSRRVQEESQQSPKEESQSRRVPRKSRRVPRKSHRVAVLSLTLESHRTNQSLMRRKRTVTKTIFTLLGAFLIFEIPFFTMTSITNLAMCHDGVFDFAEHRALILQLMFLSYLPANLDSLCNFFIYFACYTPFRRKARQFFRLRVRAAPALSCSRGGGGRGGGGGGGNGDGGPRRVGGGGGGGGGELSGGGGDGTRLVRVGEGWRSPLLSLPRLPPPRPLSLATPPRLFGTSDVSSLPTVATRIFDDNDDEIDVEDDMASGVAACGQQELCRILESEASSMDCSPVHRFYCRRQISNQDSATELTITRLKHCFVRAGPPELRSDWPAAHWPRQTDLYKTQRGAESIFCESIRGSGICDSRDAASRQGGSGCGGCQRRRHFSSASGSTGAAISGRSGANNNSAPVRRRRRRRGDAPTVASRILRRRRWQGEQEAAAAAASPASARPAAAAATQLAALRWPSGGAAPALVAMLLLCSATFILFQLLVARATLSRRNSLLLADSRSVEIGADGGGSVGGGAARQLLGEAPRGAEAGGGSGEEQRPEQVLQCLRALDEELRALVYQPVPSVERFTAQLADELARIHGARRQPQRLQPNARPAPSGQRDSPAGRPLRLLRLRLTCAPACRLPPPAPGCCAGFT
uniref:G_PROTEIN_RECEP_F1_2 domain-containing protein n=1 Tax=Macrostomum lignano TaxID=282301 RepID=A0A1I8F6M4_9PLAT